MNLDAAPSVGVQVGTRRFTARARVASSAERAPLWASSCSPRWMDLWVPRPLSPHGACQDPRSTVGSATFGELHRDLLRHRGLGHDRHGGPDDPPPTAARTGTASALGSRSPRPRARAPRSSSSLRRHCRCAWLSSCDRHAQAQARQVRDCHRRTRWASDGSRCRRPA
ncbi:MAG TPA: hypothetical protein VNP92_01755 [Actinophytocola sp.]|nr:hypothetical protein [Actinophytocola sp.]